MIRVMMVNLSGMLETAGNFDLAHGDAFHAGIHCKRGDSSGIKPVGREAVLEFGAGGDWNGFPIAQPLMAASARRGPKEAPAPVRERVLRMWRRSAWSIIAGICF
jgi:hypothetical protein